MDRRRAPRSASLCPMSLSGERRRDRPERSALGAQLDDASNSDELVFHVAHVHAAICITT